MMVEMSDPDAPAHFVRDIVPTAEKVQWYWTGQRPTLRILAVQTEGLKLAVDFSIWDVGFRQTGALELSFFVNDQLLDRVRYDSPGSKHFEKPIPPDWLKTGMESTVAISVDKLYRAPEDGAKFGIILSRAGFEKRE